MEADQYVPAYNYTCKMLKLYIPKQCFPGLLRTLLEKDFGPSIRSGFESTGLYPLNMERALAKLPNAVAPDGDVVSAVQQQLINRLASLLYNPPPTTPALRPKKKDKLPPGETYTCPVVNKNTATDSDTDEEDEDKQPRRRTRKMVDVSSDSSDYSMSSEEEERTLAVRKIIKRLGVKRKREEEERKEEEEKEEEEKEDDPDIEEQQQQPDLQQKEDCPAYTPGSYVVAVYQSDWYVGQILDKDAEPEAEGWGNDYLFISFMEKTGDLHKWPKRRDVLNTLKADVLFACQPPEICASTSSSRNTVLSLSKAESKKAKELFAQFQAYYPTKTFQLFLANCVCVCLFFHYLHTVTGYCYRTCILNVRNV